MYCQKLACSPLLLSSQFKRRTIKEIRILPGSLPWPSGHMPATCSSVILSRIVFVVARQSHKWIMFKYLQFCISIGCHITAPTTWSPWALLTAPGRGSPDCSHTHRHWKPSSGSLSSTLLPRCPRPSWNKESLTLNGLAIKAFFWKIRPPVRF